MMNRLENAARQALEALEPLTTNAELRGDSLPDGNELHSMADAGFKAITALREALEVNNKGVNALAEQAAEPVDDQHQAFVDYLPAGDDKMFEQIQLWAQQSYARHKGSVRGQQFTAADSADNHIIWATLRWAKENPAEQQAAEPVGWFESPLGEFRANPRYGITFPSRLLSWQIPLYMQPIVDGDGDDDLTITYMSGLHRGKELALAEQKLREAEQAAPTQQPLTELSPEFTDTARAALLWVLWHHQGGSSPVGQPIRFALGMGAHDRLTDQQIREAKRWASLDPKPAHGITGSKT